MKVRRALVCAPRLPEFDREGGSQRVWHLIEMLQDASWAVPFLADDTTGGERYARLLRQRGVVTYAGPESRLVGDDYLVNPSGLIAAGRFDLALLCFWDRGEAYLPTIRALSPTTRVIVDSIDLHFLRNARHLFQLQPRGDGRHQPGLDSDYADKLIRELNTYASADTVLTVSRKESDLVNDFAADPFLAHAVPLIEDLAPSTVPLTARRGLLFVGNFRHPPNFDAVVYLCCEILPLVDQALLTASPLSIVGNGLDQAVGKLQCRSSNVRLVGWVPSVVPYLERSRLTVVPLLSGAGTKTKLIQALMVGTPTVSTTIGAEGLALTPGEDVLIADDPRSFANGITRLLTDDALWTRLSASGMARIGSVHSREAVRARFLAAIEATFSRPPKPRGPHPTMAKRADEVRSVDLVPSTSR